MTSAFPLVRAADIAPFLRWLRENGRPVAQSIQLAGLPEAVEDDPARPVPLFAVLALMRGVAEREGPDIACRVVSDGSIADLGPLGEVILGTRTPREAMLRVSVAMSRHSTHETITVMPVEGGITVCEQLNLNVDDEVRHLVHQYVAALIRAMCRLTGYRGEPLRRIEMTPHPRHGLAHLGEKQGVMPVACETGVLSIFIPDDALDRPFPSHVRRTGPAGPAPDWKALRGDRPFANTAKLFIATMLDEGEPTVADLAALGGISLRTAQRRLAADGTSFSRLLDEVRRERALAALGNSSLGVGIIAAELGYSGRPAFVRAVRRWAGASPREVRNRAG